MEIKIGVQNAPRELTVDTDQTVESIEKMVAEAVEGNGVFALTDTKGRKVVVPGGKLAYVEPGAKRPPGPVLIVRFADDIVVGFQDRSDAERFQADLVERFARFSLELNAEKTRLVEFGRFAAENRRRRSLGRPETFAFLGFTHICGKTRTGRFALRRKTIAKRMAAKLREVTALLRQRRHWPIPEQGQWLGSVVRGHTAYYAVPGNIAAVSAFRKQVTRHWGRALRRRSQRHRMTWERMGRLEARWLPPARITHPWPNVRFDARTRGRSPVR